MASWAAVAKRNTCAVAQSSAGTKMTSGLRGLQVLKTTDSGFEGFLQDQFTTLKETNDRIFATTITAEWPCEKLDHDWTAERAKIRGLLLEAFVAKYSPSVQKTLHEMADVVLTECPRSQQDFARHAKSASPAGRHCQVETGKQERYFCTDPRTLWSNLCHNPSRWITWLEYQKYAKRR